MEINSILATDCGSTTTKAILIEKQDGEYRLVVRGEAPTTVEAPFDDVTVGVVNAVRGGRGALREDDPGVKTAGRYKGIRPGRDDGKGVDVYFSTSSAGGGLQMTVAGVVKSMSAESAERAALGGGHHNRRDRHRQWPQGIRKSEANPRIRPDMILSPAAPTAAP